MNATEILNNLYRILWLPNNSQYKQIKSNYKYLKFNLKISDTTVSSFGKNKRSSITSFIYKPTLFKELVKIAGDFLTDKKFKKEYDRKINLNEEISNKELIERINKVLKLYGNETESKFFTFIENNYIKMNSAYFSEIYRDQSYRLTFADEIKVEKGLKKTKPYIRYFLFWLLPNYWGWYVLALTVLLFLIGIIYSSIV